MKDPIEQIAAWASEQATNEVSRLAADTYPSPIERVFAVALETALPHFAYGARVINADSDEGFLSSPRPGNFLLVRRQFKFSGHRFDFVARTWDWEDRPVQSYLFIECDGHDFHERTKEQAAHDRALDRSVQVAGHTIYRFTGSELWRDPIKCVATVATWWETKFWGRE